MDLDQLLKSKIEEAIGALFGPAPPTIQIQPTHAGFEGSHTLVCFPLTKISKKKPEETAQLIGSWMVENSNLVARFNVVKGFLNLVLADGTWVGVFQSICEAGDYGVQPPSGQEIMVEYSSPNTNKPLHLGHLRNNFLGWSVAALYEAMGHKVHRVQIINDRGIHICKSMAAWVAFGNGETPQSSGLKGDKLVGKYYVEFDKAYKKEVNELVAGGMPQAQAEKEAPIMKEAVTLLRKWEQKDEETLSLWKKMNHWVYDGFEATYRQMGVSFDKLYYESETYLLGKSEVLKGLAQGVFFKKEDGSVWVDLAPDGLDEKVLLRSDGTSVYMTQDIGTAILRFRDFPKISRQVYTVGNEQEYHFKVLFLILAKLGYSWAKECYHLSYGMVDLPSGKMKSREGTVVDADDLMAEMIEEAGKQTRELGKIDEMDEESANELYEMIGIGALKFFLLKVDPKKRMMFNPDESIQLQGHTGPFIQYTHARIRSIVRKAATLDIKGESAQVDTLLPHEQNLISMLSAYPDKVAEAAHAYSPALIAGYAYDLAKEYNQFYQAIPIFSEDDRKKLALRVALSGKVGEILGKAMGLLGIKVPERM